jgi:hypothetical protein
LRQYIKLSKREIDGLTIYCALFYGSDGQYCDGICGPFELESTFLEGVETIVQYHEFHNYEVASDIIPFLHYYRGIPGIKVQYRLEMSEMDGLVEQELPLLRELHEFPTLIPKREPSRVNVWIYSLLKKITIKMEDQYNYE